MSEKFMTKGRLFIAIILVFAYIATVVAIVFFIAGCKPSMPTKDDFKDSEGNVNMPCYMSAVIVVANTYTENKTPVDDSLIKCYRYSDYEKCKKEKELHLLNGGCQQMQINWPLVLIKYTVR